MAAGAWYRVGTVTVTSGSVTVDGVDTLWETQVSVGDLFTLTGERFYEIDSIESNTEIKLKSAWQESTASAQSYAIIRNFTSSVNSNLAARLSDLLNRWHTREDEWFDWHNGVVDGGPNSDGKYPFTDAIGDTILIACPAKLEANLGDHEATYDHDELHAQDTGQYLDFGGVNQVGAAEIAIGLLEEDVNGDLMPTAP